MNFLEIALEIQLELSYFFFPAFKTQSTLEPPPLAISRELLVLGMQRVTSVYLQNWIFPYLENVCIFYYLNTDSSNQCLLFPTIELK